MSSPRISVVIIIMSVLSLSAGSKCRCQSECEKDVRQCYATPGHAFGTVKTDQHTPRDVLACNSQFSQCTMDCQPVCTGDL